jgi:hypothetical protein
MLNRSGKLIRQKFRVGMLPLAVLAAMLLPVASAFGYHSKSERLDVEFSLNLTLQENYPQCRWHFGSPHSYGRWLYIAGKSVVPSVPAWGEVEGRRICSGYKQ